MTEPLTPEEEARLREFITEVLPKQAGGNPLGVQLARLLATVAALRADRDRFAKAITEYGCHHGNCPYDSWNKSLSRCKCGLFRLVRDAEKVLKAEEAPR